MKIYCPKGLTVRSKENGSIMDEMAIEAVFIKALEFVQKKFPAVLPRTINVVGVQAELRNSEPVLIPSFNGIGAKHVSCEFTMQVKHFCDLSMPVPSVSLMKAKKAVAKAKTQSNVLSLLIVNGTMKIGSIGTRVTNHSTSYEVNFNDLPAEFLRIELAKVVNLINNDSWNKEREVGYKLTTSEEVAQFMDSIGMKDVMLSAVERVKAFERDNNLDKIYDESGGCISDLNLTLMVKIPLSDLFTVVPVISAEVSAEVKEVKKELVAA